MSVAQPVLYSISGLPSSGSSAIFQEVARLRREQYPGLPLALLEGSFNDDATPQRDESHAKLHATTCLLRNWADLNEACLRAVNELKSGRVVIADGFGLDAYLNAIRCAQCPQQRDEAFALHHQLVKVRIITQGVRPPWYFIPRHHPHSGNVAQLSRTLMERELYRYFDNTGQNPPIWLNGGTPRECAEEVLSYIVFGYIRSRAHGGSSA